MITISFQNEGGELDSRTAKTAEEAHSAMLDMIEAMTTLYPGDKFVVSGEEE